MIKIVAVGKIKEKGMNLLIQEYVKRLQAFTKIEVIEVNDEPTLDKNSDADNKRVLDVEAQRVLKHVKERDV